jgi:GNAT superfamily N-acetyltransferase
MKTTYPIVAARPADIPALPEIELAAARLLVGHAPDSVVNESTDEHVLLDAQAEGRLWVALDGETPVGFALAEVFSERQAHLKEIDVVPRHGRRGVGTALAGAVCCWGRRRGFEELTLSTFRAPRWNKPFYARLGFEEVPGDDLTPALRAIVRDETACGLDPRSRVVMRYRFRGDEPAAGSCR